MIAFRHVTIHAGACVLDDFSFEVPDGQYAVLMGKTGSGKSTILEVVCGLKSIERGSILLAGIDVTGWHPGDRGVGYVPQDRVLFPTLTVRGQLEFALRLRGASKKQIAERTDEMAEMLGIGQLLSRRVDKLSGGESQRVALGRALSFRPKVLLLDEPLSALDEATREEMQQLLLKVKRLSETTTLHVTHNLNEAKALADKTFSIQDGKILDGSRDKEP